MLNPHWAGGVVPGKHEGCMRFIIILSSCRASLALALALALLSDPSASSLPFTSTLPFPVRFDDLSSPLFDPPTHLDSRYWINFACQVLLHARPLSWHLAPSPCRTHTTTRTLQQTARPWRTIGPIPLSTRSRHSSLGGVERGEFFFFGVLTSDVECRLSRKERGMMWVGRVQTTTYS